MRGFPRPNLYALACALAVIVCVLASHPVAEIGINDDWSYVRSAALLAQTGHVMYIGWASAMLGWMLPLGAVFVKLFGFSFTAVRASGVLVAVLTAYLLQRCFARAGLNERNAFIAALTIVLCPIYLPLATTFMSDIPGVLVTLLCFYGCVRALETQSDRACFGWLVLACAGSVLGGTARQTAWLGAMVMVPSAASLLRRRRIPWVVLGAVWLLSLGFAYGSLRWFHRQPYSLREALVGGYMDRDLLYAFVAHLVQAALALCLLLVPVLAAFVPQVRLRVPQVRRWIVGASVAVGLFGHFCVATHRVGSWLAPFDGNYFSENGLVNLVEIGTRPAELYPSVRVALTLLTLVCAIGTVGYVLAPGRERPEPESAPSQRTPRLRELLVLLGPFTLAYVVLMAHRALFERAYDRYLLVLLFVPLLLLGRLYQERVRPRLPAFCIALAVAAGVYTVAANHDLFAMQRARLEATETLQRAGISRDRFFAGWEYDGWTQVDRYGFINTGWMNTPTGFTEQPPIPYTIKPTPCKYGWARFFPAIHPQFAVSFSPSSCDGPSSFAPVAYTTWLPPFRASMYIDRVVVRGQTNSSAAAR